MSMLRPTQTYYVKIILEQALLPYDGRTSDFVQRPEFAKCAGKSDSYDLWECREQVWNRSFRGKSVGGESFPNDRFGATFFQPYYAGQTFGLGQLNPLTALQMSDLVHKVSGLPKLDVADPNSVYKTIGSDLTLPYSPPRSRNRSMPQEHCRLRLSRAPVTSTPKRYNIGNPEEHAFALPERQARAAGEPDKLPEKITTAYYWRLIVRAQGAVLEPVCRPDAVGYCSVSRNASNLRTPGVHPTTCCGAGWRQIDVGGRIAEGSQCAPVLMRSNSAAGSVGLRGADSGHDWCRASPENRILRSGAGGASGRIMTRRAPRDLPATPPAPPRSAANAPAASDP
jgi:hypothetical protein